MGFDETSLRFGEVDAPTLISSSSVLCTVKIDVDTGRVALCIETHQDVESDTPTITMEQPTVIETDGLTKRYGAVTAVKDLYLRVLRGQVFGLLGPNGSGKTTTIGMLLGLVRPSSGTVRLFGKELDHEARGALARIGAIMETPAFYPYLTGRANLEYFQGITGRGATGELQRLLDLVGLSDRADQKFATYSLGMKYRLGIAYALLGDPELLLLDEPTNGLDPGGG